MKIADAHKLFGGIVRQGSYPGLERIRALMDALGDPQDRLKFVHVAGTNGKGSVSAMTASVLREAGYRTGLYISPALVEFNERIQAGGQPIPDGEAMSLFPETAEAARTLTARGFDPPSEFEAVTAMGFLWFARQKCDIVVLEVGLGGRLDATNAISAPEVAVITALGMDHMAELGNTLGQIAGEKAAIIKTGCEAVSDRQEPEAAAVLRQRCAERNVPLTAADFDMIRVTERGIGGQRFDYGPEKGLNIALLGVHQPKNAAVVIETVFALRRRGWQISDRALREGLAKTVWPARMEVLSAEPLVLLDGAHNLHAVRELSASLDAFFPGRRFIFVCGISGGKEYDDMLAHMARFASCIILTKAPNPRIPPPENLAETAGKYYETVLETQDIPSALETARQKQEETGLPVCCFGSLYVAGGVLSCLRENGSADKY